MVVWVSFRLGIDGVTMREGSEQVPAEGIYMATHVKHDKGENTNASIGAARHK